MNPILRTAALTHWRHDATGRKPAQAANESMIPTPPTPWQLSRSKRQPTCIDTESDPGSYAFLIAHGAHSMQVSEYGADEAWLEQRLALRKAARFEPNAHKRGWLTRAIDRAAR